MSAAYAVIGWPLGHTLSPVMHQAALEELGLDATYTALPTPPGTESDRFDDVRTGNLAGLNVTIPHKLAAFRAVDRRTPAAERTGAVNTVIRDGPRLLGDNTDPYGFIQALRQFGGFDPAGASVVVLGAGGAARAAVIALLDSGARRILVANRTPARAHELANDLQASNGAPIHSCALTDPRLTQHLSDAQLLVNTSSVGMSGGPAPTASPVPPDHLHPNLFVYDIVYRPAVTPLLAAAQQCGAPTLGGLEMLVMQGAASLQQWTGRPAPARTMLTAARTALIASESP
ncbi:MAG: shikimate dehydrogenase [Chloroflexi bacterium]|nr:shikimate dehydrogenase [Chloroflexota bacterium]